MKKGGAPLVIKDGALENPRPDAIFGLHVISGIPAGMITYRAGPLMASADWLYITVKGKQTHGAWPWAGIDPVITSAQIVSGLQNIVARQIDVSREPAVVTVATIHGGTRKNIIPDQVEMTGTIRTFDEDMRQDVHARIKHIAESIAEANNAKAEVRIDKAVPVTVNDPALTEKMLPTLKRIGGEGGSKMNQRVMVAEDFFLLPAADTGHVLLRGHHAERPGHGQGGAESLPALFCRRIRTAAGNPVARRAGSGFPDPETLTTRIEILTAEARRRRGYAEKRKDRNSGCGQCA